MNFQDRIKLAAQCQDCASIPKVYNAGKTVVKNGRTYQVMHNGLLVPAGGYYGDWITELIRQSNGHHEPQEELLFNEVLKTMPDNAVMIEVGCYWAYYSAWFAKTVMGARLFPIEPIDHRLSVGQETLEINQINARITHAAIKAESAMHAEFVNGPEVAHGILQLSIDDFVHQRQIEHVNILHADIQGYENQMLTGAVNSFDQQMIDWVFLSTHRHLEDGLKFDLHKHCLEWLEDKAYIIIESHTPEESFSVDGLILARSPRIDFELDVKISKRMI